MSQKMPSKTPAYEIIFVVLQSFLLSPFAEGNYLQFEALGNQSIGTNY